MTAFSVVVCTLRRPEAVRRVLESLVVCDPRPFETIVVDGDEDESARPVAGSFAGVSYRRSPPGLTRQRNVGLAVCKGDVVAFFDDDARVAPDLFARLERAYRDPAVVGATGQVIEPVDERIGGASSFVRRLITPGDPGTFTRSGHPRRGLARVDQDSDVELMQGCFMTARRQDAVLVGFDESLPGYGLAEDEDFSYRLSRRGRIRYLVGATVYHDNTGFLTADRRRFGCQLAVNRTYLFRKNFQQTARARVQFSLMLVVLLAHRAINRDWAGIRGLLDGVVEVRRKQR